MWRPLLELHGLVLVLKVTAASLCPTGRPAVWAEPGGGEAEESLPWLERVRHQRGGAAMEEVHLTGNKFTAAPPRDV